MIVPSRFSKAYAQPMQNSGMAFKLHAPFHNMEKGVPVEEPISETGMN